MDHSKFTVITKTDLATGFRLAGLTVHEVSHQDEAREILYDIYNKGDHALIAVDEELLPEKDKKFQKLMEDKPLPVIFPLQRPQLKEAINQEEYVSELAKSCIGFYIKIT